MANDHRGPRNIGDHSRIFALSRSAFSIPGEVYRSKTIASCRACRIRVFFVTKMFTKVSRYIQRKATVILAAVAMFSLSWSSNEVELIIVVKSLSGGVLQESVVFGV